MTASALPRLIFVIFAHVPSVGFTILATYEGGALEMSCRLTGEDIGRWVCAMLYATTNRVLLL